MSLLQKWRLPGGMRDLHKEQLLCSGVSPCLLPPWVTQKITFGWAGELPESWSLSGGTSRRLWGQWEVQAEVWAWPGVWHQHPRASSFPPSHPVTEPWLPPRFPPAPDSQGGQEEASQFQISSVFHTSLFTPVALPWSCSVPGSVCVPIVPCVSPTGGTGPDRAC